MTRRIDHGDDSGAALILVLIVVTVIGISLAALLSFSDTSIRATVNLRGQAATAYEADGAMQAAINNIRNSGFNGAAGQHCFGGADTLSLPSFSGSDSAAVSCAADPAKVLIQCPSLSQCNRPGSAILTLGRTSEDGINIQQPTGSAFRVHGVVFSNSNINVVNGSLSTNTAVYARGACSGTVQSNPSPASCNYGSAANPLGNDPGYQPAVSTVPVYRPVPACGSGSVVSFEPGYYDDAVGLSSLMSGSQCKNKVWWFKPGAYYFDFHNDTSRPNPNPLLTSGKDVWTVNNGSLVAGTPINAAGSVVSTPPSPATIPGACDNPINDAKAVGVQFIFGGDSQFAVKAGQVEICGTYSASTPPVAVYGLKSGTETTSTSTLPATSVPDVGQFTNATQASLASADGNLASWTTQGKQTGTFTAAGFSPSSPIPAGSILSSAKVLVWHGNTASAESKVSVTVSPNGGTPQTVTGQNFGAVAQDSIDVTSSLAPLVYAGTYTGARVTYSATVQGKSTEQVDATQLVLTYVAPAFRAESGCTTTGPYTGVGNGSSCALVTSVNNSGNQFYVQGTTYAPGAVLDVTLNNATEQIFRFGVVARSLWIKETGSFSYTGVVIEVPDDAPGFVFSIYLSAYVCPSSSSCSSGSPVVNARIAYVDADPTNPAPGHRQVSVLSWSSTR